MLQYEFHPTENINMPFIYHYDTIKNEHDISNWHENIEILYVTDGEGFIVTDNQKIPAQAGDIFVINSYISHKGISNKVLKYFCLIIDCNFCSFNGFDTNNILYQNKINDQKAQQCIEAIMQELETNTPYKEGAVKTYVLNLLLYITKNYCLSFDNSPRHTKNADNIKTAIGYIRSHFNERLTIEQLTDQAGLSKYYFSREFKRLTGMTVITYVNYVKCENAKKLFSSKNYSINEISEMCGFENLSYFSKTFKQFSGQSPTAYIKSL